MASIREDNPQLLRVLELVQAAGREAINSGGGGRIIFPDDLPFSNRRLADWNGPAVSYRESLAKIGKSP